jgi:hypothetical protein
MRYVHQPGEATAMEITTVAIDLEKNLIQVHGMDERGKTVLKKQLKRAQLASFFAKLPPCLIGLEARRHAVSRTTGRGSSASWYTP